MKTNTDQTGVGVTGPSTTEDATKTIANADATRTRNNHPMIPCNCLECQWAEIEMRRMDK